MESIEYEQIYYNIFTTDNNRFITFKIPSTICLSGQSLETLKDDARRLKQDVLKCMIENIEDQNSEESVAGLFSLFDLSSDESKEGRIEKIEKLHDVYGNTIQHTVDAKWYLNLLSYEFQEPQTIKHVD